jgi:hypothetical protein
MSDWILWKGCPLPKQKKSAHRVGARDVGAPATLGSFAHTVQKKDDNCKPGPTGTL